MKRLGASTLFLTSLLTVLAPISPAVAQQRWTAVPKEFSEWLPVTEPERQSKSPVVDKEAGAEVLMWRVHVVDQEFADGLQRVFYHYLRVKVFNTSGSEKVGTVDLTYGDSERILDVSGRTIKPNGSITELDRNTVYKRDILRAGGRTIKAVSFAMPGVENGAILEYRWRQIQDDNRFRYLRLEFTRDVPVQRVTYFVKPLSRQYASDDQLFIMAFHCATTPLQVDDEGWVATSVTNIPADVDEPYAPSDANVKPWALLYYRDPERNPQKYWNGEAKRTYNDFKDALKLDADQKSASLQAVAGATNDDDKIALLVAFVNKRLRRPFDDEVTAAERDTFIKKLPKDRDRTAAEILKSGIAFQREVNVAFGAVAAQAGLDVRPVLVTNRREVLADPRQVAERYFVDDFILAMKSGDSWKMFNVDRKQVQPGMLPADEEGMYAIVTDQKAAIFAATSISPPEASVEKRSASLTLLPNGSLTGDVKETYSGHRAEEPRSALARQAPAQREQWVHDRVVRMFPDANVEAIKIENLDNPSLPLQLTYRLDAPFFAQVTGKRMLFSPNAFKRSAASPFAASERRLPILFPFAWKEVDDIELNLPTGFQLEQAENPGGLDFGDPGGYKLTMSVRTGAATQLLLSREFTFGLKGLLQFQPEAYPALKKAFDEVQLRDTHVLSLKAD